MIDIAVALDKAKEAGVFAALIGPAMLVLFLIAYRLMNPGRSGTMPKMSVQPPGAAYEMMHIKVGWGEIDRILDNPRMPFVSGDVVWLLNDNYDALRQWTGEDGRKRATVFFGSGRELRIEETSAGRLEKISG